MANEATLVLKNDEPTDFIVLDANGIEKGTAMVLSGSSTVGMTALASSNVTTLAALPFAGIARREKIADDGRTRLSCFRRGHFRMKAAATIIQGQPVRLSGSNLIIPAIASSLLSGCGVGIAAEDMANQETKIIFVGGY